MEIKRVTFLTILLIGAIEITALLLYFSTTSFYSVDKRLTNIVMSNYLNVGSHRRHRFKRHRRGKSVGYVLATHYVDQLSGSTINVFTLQCWAATLPGNVKVVEPFLHFGSLFGLQLDPTKPKYDKGNSNQDDVENTVTMFEMYDYESWNSLKKIQNYADMVSWKYFLRHSPKKLILVDKICSNNGKCMACGEKDFFESDLFLKSALKFAQFYNFSIVRKTCYEHRIYTERKLMDIVYGAFEPDKVAVIFNRFGGFAPKGDVLRISLSVSNCYRGPHFGFNFKVHENIKRQAKEYIKQFMPNTSTSGYISVAFRTEQFSIANQLMTHNKHEQLERMNLCVEKLASAVKTYKKRIGARNVFLTTDAGKYGAAAFRKLDPNHYFHHAVLDFPGARRVKKSANQYYFHKDVLITGLKKLHKLLFGKVVPLHKKVEAVVSKKSPGYVALLEMILTANATCVVLAGGGSFHSKIIKYHRILKSYSWECVKELNCD